MDYYIEQRIRRLECIIDHVLRVVGRPNTGWGSQQNCEHCGEYVEDATDNRCPQCNMIMSPVVFSVEPKEVPPEKETADSSEALMQRLDTLQDSILERLDEIMNVVE